MSKIAKQGTVTRVTLTVDMEGVVPRAALADLEEGAMTRMQELLVDLGLEDDMTVANVTVKGDELLIVDKDSDDD